jgi:hypothetical protein
MAVTVRRKEISAERIREGIFLLGSYDGMNRQFAIPEPAVHDPPRRQVKVYHGGRRLQGSEYIVRESVPGGGYDLVQLIFAPQTTGRLYADYIAA